MKLSLPSWILVSSLSLGVLPFAGCGGCDAEPIEGNADDDGGERGTDGARDGLGDGEGDGGEGLSEGAPDGSNEGALGDGEGSADGSDEGEAFSDDGCLAGSAMCLDAFHAQICLDHGDGTHWVVEACAEGSGCVSGSCTSSQCSDDCNPAVDADCVLVDAATRAARNAALSSMADKARSYQERLKRNGLVFGGIADIVFADDTYEVPHAAGGTGDSAIWTGTYLAAQAFRYRETGAAEARARIRETVTTLHDWFNVSGAPGVLARFVRPAGANWVTSDGDVVSNMGNWDCAGLKHHCNQTYRGQQWDYRGSISRDQYTGVMLGLAAAYDALDANDEDLRVMIRDDIMELAAELMTERTIPMTLSLYFPPVNLGVTTVDHLDYDVNITLKHSVLIPEEMVDGKVTTLIGLTENTDVPFTNDRAYMTGYQEFMPDYGTIIDQVDLPPWLDWALDAPIPRPGSAFMLHSIMLTAAHVSEGVPQYAAQHQAIVDYIDENAGPEIPGGGGEKWLDYAFAWTLPACGFGYYGNNITYNALYNITQYETDALRETTVFNALMDLRINNVLGDHKNSWFTYITEQTPGISVEADQMTSANAQLMQFPFAPRRAINTDVTGQFDEDPECPGYAINAIDLGVRPPAEFQWQRPPFGMTAFFEAHQTFPGVDYLVAYWLGRLNDFVPDNDDTACWSTATGL